MGAHHGHHDMGHTVAGWTGSVIAILGTTATGLALIADSTTALIAGLTLTALGAFAAWLLHLAGWGKPTGPRPPNARDWRHRDPAARTGHPNCLGCRLAGRTPTALTAVQPAPPRRTAHGRADDLATTSRRVPGGNPLAKINPPSQPSSR